MRKIYIAGKITGLPLDDVKKKFKDYRHLISKECISQGVKFEIINPLSLHKCFGCGGCNEDLPMEDVCSGSRIITRTYDEYMRIGLKKLLDCNEIHMLPDWKDSNGAKIEYKLAVDLKMKIVYV